MNIKRDVRIKRAVRDSLKWTKPLGDDFSDIMGQWNLIDSFTNEYNKFYNEHSSSYSVFASFLIVFAYQCVISKHVQLKTPDFFARHIQNFERKPKLQKVIDDYINTFPSLLINKTNEEEKIRSIYVWSVMLDNRAMCYALGRIISPGKKFNEDAFRGLLMLLGNYPHEISNRNIFEKDLYSFLTEPARIYPDSLYDQLDFILSSWSSFLPSDFLAVLLKSKALLKEANKSFASIAGKGNYSDYAFRIRYEDYEGFSFDKDWMPNVVMVAKNVLVWFSQISRDYQREIRSLYDIPDEVLEELSDLGINTLWLIGVWKRSPASREIKRRCGNALSQASAYSIYDYTISDQLGGQAAMEDFKRRCLNHKIRLASDMVPNHTGIDSLWIQEHPEYFMSQSTPPFSSYKYESEDLSCNSDIEIKIEDHYYSKEDAAVTFMRRDKRTGETKYIFHGNDGTSMPWNDTAQLDYLNPSVREAVIQKTIEISKTFPIIRFDAAMTLASRHIRRLWYPELGSSGAIPGRTMYQMSDEEFIKHLPQEFWRTLVDRMAKEAPDTLLLAEAFWMLEGYFVRTLGMHRVYNSAFMNMLKNEQNAQYKGMLKDILLTDSEILRRYVNFMNNPDEESAKVQFGVGDKYFGVATLLVTMPGLPMFGHGQFDGFEEKYGMEFSSPLLNEKRDNNLFNEHKKMIVPLLKRRYEFSTTENFNLFDFTYHGNSIDSVFAYTNGFKNKKNLVVYNNSYETLEGKIRHSFEKTVNNQGKKEKTSFSIFNALDLNFSGKSFMVYKTFHDGLSHLLPTTKVAEEGLSFNLKGYQCEVWLDIVSIDDTDGKLQKLWEKYGNNGFDSKLLSNNHFKFNNQGLLDVHNLVKKRIKLKNSTQQRQCEEDIAGKLLEYWQSEDEIYREVAINYAIPSKDSLIKFVKKIFTVSTSSDFISSLVNAMDFYPEYITVVLTLFPYFSQKFENPEGEGNSKRSSDVVKDLFEDEVEALGCTEFIKKNDLEFKYSVLLNDENKISTNDIIRIVKNACFGYFSLEIGLNLNTLLKIIEFLDLIGFNEYDSVKWYVQEEFQEEIVVFSLFYLYNSLVRKKDLLTLSKFICECFEREVRSNYRFDRLTNLTS